MTSQGHEGRFDIGQFAGEIALIGVDRDSFAYHPLECLAKVRPAPPFRTVYVAEFTHKFHLFPVWGT